MRPIDRLQSGWRDPGRAAEYPFGWRAPSCRCYVLASGLVALGLVIAASSPLQAGAGGGGGGGGPALRLDDPGRVRPACTGTVQHPLEVRVRSLDPIRRGATVRLEVRTTARAPIANAEVRLVSPGGAAVAGATRLPLGRLAPQREVAGTFSVVVPDQGRRFLVQFVVGGEGAAGPLSRGAVYNLLPDGPFDPGRQVTGPDGARVLEFAAARSGR